MRKIYLMIENPQISLLPNDEKHRYLNNIESPL